MGDTNLKFVGICRPYQLRLISIVGRLLETESNVVKSTSFQVILHDLLVVDQIFKLHPDDPWCKKDFHLENMYFLWELVGSVVGSGSNEGVAGNSFFMFRTQIKLGLHGWPYLGRMVTNNILLIRPLPEHHNILWYSWNIWRCTMEFERLFGHGQWTATCQFFSWQVIQSLS